MDKTIDSSLYATHVEKPGKQAAKRRPAAKQGAKQGLGEPDAQEPFKAGYIATARWP